MTRSFRAVLVLGLLLSTIGEMQSAYIYFSETGGGRIGRANLDGTGKVTLISGVSLPVGPTLDVARGHMYWGELGSASMRRANLDGSGQITLVNSPNGGLPALDLAGGRMYCVVSSSGNIWRGNLDGSAQQLLITGQNDPHAPVLDVGGGKFYWAEYGAGNILRANLDGTGRQTLVAGLANSTLVALDLARGKIYWTVERANGDIRRANLDGSSQETLVLNQNNPAGIALDGNNRHLYWANNGGGDIRRANLDGTGQQILISGLSGISIVTLDVDSGAPSIHIQPQGATIPVETPVTLNAATPGAKPLFFQWYLNDAPLAQATNATLQIPSASTSDAGDYRLYVSNSLGTATSQVARLVVVDSPIITTQPVSRRIVESNSATFVVSAIGASPLSFQWQFNGTNLDGATTTNLTLANVQTNQVGEYTVVVSNSFGSITSTVATLTVLVRPRLIQQPQSQTVLEGGTVTFAASASGTLPLGFRWLRSGVIFSNGIVNTATTSSLTLTNVGMSNNAVTFRLVVTNEAGSVSSTNARLSVLADFDRDGMADEWEARYGLDTNSIADAVLDPDGDGLSNREEYVAATDPLDGASALRIELFALAEGELTLAFVAVSNRTYSVLSSPGVPAALWEKIVDVGSQPSNRLELITVPATAVPTQRFYRVAIPQ